MSEDRFEPKDEDVEAHGLPATEDLGDESDDVEAHKHKARTDEGDDFELHKHKARSDEGDDFELHKHKA